MLVYEITLPLKTNAGLSARPAHRAFRAWLLEQFGGYSQAHTLGAWKDDEGATYHDASIVYRVATNDLPPAYSALDGAYRAKWSDELAKEAARVFPDQLAFFVARVGEAEIIARPAKP